MSDNFLFNKEYAGSYDIQRKVLPMTISGYENANLFFMNVTGDFDVNYQLNYAFSDDVYIYVFGDRLSIMSITGLSFPGECSKATVAEFMKFYKAKKLTYANPTSSSSSNLAFSSVYGGLQGLHNNQTGYTKKSSSGSSSVSIAFGGSGGVVVEGYFIGMSMHLISNTEDTFQFTLKLLGKVVS